MTTGQPYCFQNCPCNLCLIVDRRAEFLFMLYYLSISCLPAVNLTFQSSLYLSKSIHHAILFDIVLVLANGENEIHLYF